MNWREIKKVELHRHLEGSIRLGTLLDAAMESKTVLPTYELPRLKQEAIVFKPMKDLASVLKRLFLFQKILSSAEIIKRVAYENCIDAYADGIRVLELRYSPGFIALGHPNLTYDIIHQSILEGIDQGNKDLQNKLAVGLIGIISRDVGMDEAEKTADFVINNSKTFVGFDLAGDEKAFHSRLFIKQFERMRATGLGVTVHSGEIREAGSALLVKESIENLGAQRIGHGLMIINDPEVIEFVKSKNVVLEICPTSNVLTGAVDCIKDHPIRKLMDAGVRVTLNSDDPQFFGISLSHEYQILSRELDFSAVDFEKLNAEALKATFISQDLVQKAWN